LSYDSDLACRRERGILWWNGQNYLRCERKTKLGGRGINFILNDPSQKPHHLAKMKMLAREQTSESELTMSCRSLRPQAADGLVWVETRVHGRRSQRTLGLSERDAGDKPRGKMGGRGQMSRCVAGSLADWQLKTASLAAISGSPFAVCYFIRVRKTSSILISNTLNPS
jgi:hypothetical protein